MRSSELVTTLIKAFAPVITILASYLSLKLTKWLDTKIKDQELKNAIQKLNIVIPDVVKDIEQSFVQREKSISESNKLTDANAVAAKTMAVDRVKQQLGEKGMGEIKQVLDISDSKANSLIASKVEARVFDLRKSATAVVLALIFVLGMSACTAKAHVLAAGTIKANEAVVATADDSIARWYMVKHGDCLGLGQEVKKKSLSTGADDATSKKIALDAYNGCIKDTDIAAEKIADIIDVIRSKDKVAAGVALAVAKGEKPVEALGYVIPEVAKLIEDLTKLLKAVGVK